MLYQWLRSEGREFAQYLAAHADSECADAFVQTTASYVVVQNSSRANFFCFPIHEVVAGIRAVNNVLVEGLAEFPEQYDETAFRLLGLTLRQQADAPDFPVLATHWGVQSKTVYNTLVAFIGWINGHAPGTYDTTAAAAVSAAAARLAVD